MLFFGGLDLVMHVTYYLSGINVVFVYFRVLNIFIRILALEMALNILNHQYFMMDTVY